MEIELIKKLSANLKKINFQGSVVLCGYGEPMLHKQINEIVKILADVCFVEIVTNGDPLSPKKIKDLYNSNLNKLLISLYDGPEQIEKFKKMGSDAEVPEDFIILRDRWYDSKTEYGLKLTNRTGTIKVGPQPEIGEYKDCYYPSYQVLIDWNGDVSCVLKCNEELQWVMLCKKIFLIFGQVSQLLNIEKIYCGKR